MISAVRKLIAQQMPTENFSISAIWGPPGQAPPRLRSRRV